MNALNCLPKKTRKTLEDIGNCWRLEVGSKHIRIIVNETMAGIVPKRVRGDGSGLPGRQELNVISQIRRAARGAASNRRLAVAV
ncbi:MULTISPECIES: hypothetical protein [unclassified Ensifer]|uniref:hypothetical protein n=1 Tax=unclassified Ensifer TaxID=2633371 RepID=UPI000813AFAF|nr:MULTISPECIES: hypothetical protein [unclassified Ensifer]OCP21959.1 hypothetical protein BC361_25660 [Ensifer sp. LC54]OCP23261.1 hypothetical protein BC363_25105 [Ensifer sp. LC384]